MTRTAFASLSLALLGSLVPACSSDGPSGPAQPSGPAPAVLLDIEFGESPVEGTLRIVPAAGTIGWHYRVDPIPPATEVSEGPLTAVVTIPYRFDVPGVHLIQVELTGPTGPEGAVVIPKFVVVVDPVSDFEVLAQRPIDEIWPDGEDMAPEGIVLDPAGRWLYAARYRSGELVRIDPETLEVVDRVVLGPSLEGLAVASTGDRLFAIHKNSGLSVVDLESFTATHIHGLSGHFIIAMDDSHALFGGSGVLGRANVDTGEIHWATLSGSTRHFSVFPDGDRVVSLMSPSFGVPEHPSLEILSLPSLDPIHSIPLLDPPNPEHVAVDPSGDAMYVFGKGEDFGVRFLALDPATGEVIRSMSLAGSGCSSYCVANPVVTFASGRYVAFELGGAVVVVDTALDLPRYRFDLGGYDYDEPSGVAAHPDSDILYVLGPAGRLFKLRLRNP